MPPRANSFGYRQGGQGHSVHLGLLPSAHGEFAVAPTSLYSQQCWAAYTCPKGSYVPFSCPPAQRTGHQGLHFHGLVVYSLNGSFLDSKDTWILKTA